MKLYQEIHCHVLANEKVQVSSPELVNTDVTKIVELECYKVLHKIKTILEDGVLENSICFQKLRRSSAPFRNWVPTSAVGMISDNSTDE